MKYKNIFTNKSISLILISIYLFFSPIEFALNAFLPGGSSLKYLGFIIILLVLYDHKNTKINFNSTHKYVILWVLLMGVSLFWTFNSPYALLYTRMYTFIAIYFVVLSLYRVDKKNVEIFLFSALYGATFAALLLIFSGATLVGSTSERVTLSIFGAQMDPNASSVLMAFGVIIAFYFLMYRKKTKLLLIPLIICSLAVILTGSRSGLFGTMFSAFVLFANYLMKNKSSVLKKMSQVIAIITIVTVIVNIIVKVVPVSVIQRLVDFESYSGGSNRDIIWGSLFPYFKQKPFMGYGIGSSVELTRIIFSKYTGAHNTYLQVLLDLGIIGLFTFLMIPGSIVIRSIKYKNIFAISLILLVIIPALFLDSINQRYFWNSLILSSMILMVEK